MTTPKKQAQPRKRPPTNPRRPKGKPGPIPLVLRGFDRKLLAPRYQDATIPPDPWTNHSPATRVLQSLRTGATWVLASGFARVSADTTWRWNSRGQTAMQDQLDLSVYAATDIDDETLACAAFHVLATQAMMMPAVGALSTITRAAGTDWRAAAKLIAILPDTKNEYSEIQKLEHSGPDGDPISVEVRAKNLAAILRGRQAPTDGDDVDDTDDGAGEG